MTFLLNRSMVKGASEGMNEWLHKVFCFEDFLSGFLVACYATLHPAMLVRWLVGWSVGRSPFDFFGVFELFGQRP